MPPRGGFDYRILTCVDASCRASMNGGDKGIIEPVSIYICCTNRPP